MGHKRGKRYRRMVQNPKRDRSPLKEINGNKRKFQLKYEIIEEVGEQDWQVKKCKGDVNMENSNDTQKGKGASPTWSLSDH